MQNPGWRRGVPVALLLLATPGLVRLYRTNPRLGNAPETVSSGLTALSLLRDGDLDLREYYPAAVPGRDPRYSVRWHGEALHGIEPLASSLTFAPFLLPYRDLPVSAGPFFFRLFTAVASQVATLALVGLGLWLLRLAPPGRALLATAVIGVATCYRTINGTGLWQHTSAALWLVLGLALWSGAPGRPGLYPIAGAALALATACRPILVPAALLAVVDASRRAGGRRALATAALVASIGAAALFANWYLHGSVLGGRAPIVTGIARTHAVPAYFHFSPVHLVGLLAAPSRGLFIYSPVLLFALPGLARALGSGDRPPLRLITLAGVLTFVLYGFIATWWGGWVFGPRYMTDLLPYFALWLVLAPARRRWGTVLFATALAWSVAVQQLGAMTYPCGWNQSPANVDVAPARLWDWRDTEIARCVATLAQRWTAR